MRRLQIDDLYARHREELLLFLARRTADPQIALDLWAETFAQAVAGGRKYRGGTEAEAAGWLYPDLARNLGITEQAARARVSRGLSKLAELLDAATIQRARTV